MDLDMKKKKHNFFLLWKFRERESLQKSNERKGLAQSHSLSVGLALNVCVCLYVCVFLLLSPAPQGL